MSSCVRVFMLFEHAHAQLPDCFVSAKVRTPFRLISSSLVQLLLLSFHLCALLPNALFLQKCVAPLDARPSASQLLEDPFLSIKKGVASGGAIVDGTFEVLSWKVLASYFLSASFRMVQLDACLFDPLV